MNTKKILVVVDYQKDFASPEGALYVPEAEEISQIIQSHINSDIYEDIIYTMDTHITEDYINSKEAELFPDHCVYGTEGWGFHEIQPRSAKISEVIQSANTTPPRDFSHENEFVFVKNEFSIWKGNSTYKNFIMQRYEPQNTEFVVVGVATNYCVFENAIGYKEIGFENVTVIQNATKGILDETFESNIKEMKSKNIRYE